MFVRNKEYLWFHDKEVQAWISFQVAKKKKKLQHVIREHIFII
jgi:hypothetical protein